MNSNSFSHYDFANEIPDPDDFNEEPTAESEEKRETSLEIIQKMNGCESLDQLILKSLSSIEDEELKRKLASNILVCGGGAMIGEQQDLTDILDEQLQKSL